jgi:catechol 2,3-dioxygenase-like lactoylglutathione lyase family enzyme
MESEDRTAAGVAPRTGLDHIAHPSFDVEVTHRFYTEVLGAQLDAAAAGESEAWGCAVSARRVSARGRGNRLLQFRGVTCVTFEAVRAPQSAHS